MVNENWLAFSHLLFCTYHSFCFTLYVATKAYGFEDDYVLIMFQVWISSSQKSACNELSTSVVLGNHFWGAKVATKAK